MEQAASRIITDFSDCRILVTNDDGIHAPGLKVLEEAAKQLSSDVWVVAPEAEQSGAGHSLSIHAPLRYVKYDDRRFGVKGTPTDCVLLAVEQLLPKSGKRPDIVLSGVNRGNNVAEDVTHSGTIAATMEGTLCGIPSIAFSQAFAMWDADVQVHYDLAKKHIAELVRQIMAAGLPPLTLMNVNFPDLPEGTPAKGVKVVAQGRRPLGKELEERHDKKGRPYYWVSWDYDDAQKVEGETDLTQISAGYITLTPLKMDLTDYSALESFSKKVVQSL